MPGREHYVGWNCDPDGSVILSSGYHVLPNPPSLPLVFITVYAALAAEFIWRFFNDRPVRGDATSRQPEEPRVVMDKQLKTMIIALAFNTFCLYVRYAAHLMQHRHTSLIDVITGLSTE